MDAVSLSLHARGSADAPVPGQVPSFAVSLSELEVARATTIVCWVIPSIFAVIRLHFKICVLRLVKVSDYAMLISWLLFLAHVAMIWLSIIRDTSPGHRDFVSLEAYNYTGTFLYAVCLFLLKASILLQFIEVFAAQHLRDWFFWACHGLIWSTCVWCVVTVPLGLWGCPPFQPDSSPDSSTGSSTRAGDSCVAHPDVMDVCSGVFNTASDVSILILPLTRTWALQMPLRKKLAVSAVFAVGFLATTAAAVRLAYSSLRFTTAGSLAYYRYMRGLWTPANLEIACGIIAGCLPSTSKSLRMLWRHPTVAKWRGILPSFLSLSGLSSSRNKSGRWSEGEDQDQNAGPAREGSDDHTDRDAVQGRNKRWSRSRVRAQPDQYPLTSFATEPGTRRSGSSSRTPSVR